MHTGQRITLNKYVSTWDTSRKLYAVFFLGAEGVVYEVNEGSCICIIDTYPDYKFRMDKEWID